MADQTTLDTAEQGPGDNGVNAALQPETAQGPAELRPGSVWINRRDGEMVQIDSIGEAFLRAHWVRSGNGLNQPIAEFSSFFEYYGTRAPEPRFPLDSYREAAPYLRRPFTKEAVKWKVQSAFGDKGFLVVAYIDARLVIERLNHVIPHLWTEDFQTLPDGTVICRLTVDDITREDLGKGSGPEGAKGSRSDALKRAAVHFGVGVSVYAIPRVEIWRSDDSKAGYFKYKHIPGGNGKKEQHVYRLEPKGEAALRAFYGEWLDRKGIKSFGDPIDHGDVEDSAGEAPEPVGGDAAEEAGSDLAAGAAVPVVDAKADELRIQARDCYQAISKLPKGKTKLPPAKFESQLRSASTSHADLETFLTTLRELKESL